MLTTSNYLRELGVPPIPPSTSPFDPGYDPATLESHLEQSSHLKSTLKISMAYWMVANGLRHPFRVELPLRCLFEKPTISRAGRAHRGGLAVS